MDPLLKLLIADDETRFLRTIAQRLQLRGLEVHTAQNGPEAIALAERETFDVALLDLKMPGMDGSQVHLELKKIDPLLETIILTGHGSMRSAVELAQLGAFGYLPKPYELDKLIDVLARAYARRLRNKLAQHPEQLRALEALDESGDPLQRLQLLKALDQEP